MSVMTASFRLRRSLDGRLATLLRYLAVGGATSLMDYAGFALLNALLGMAPWAANVLSYGGSSVANYLMHRRWTFRDRHQRAAAAQFAQYTLLVAFSLAANTWLVSMFVPLAGGLVEDAVTASLLAKVAAAALVWAWNLISSNLVVFRGERG
jgi:putative flippase GtrA